MPHLERQTTSGEWIVVEKTTHNYDPKSKSKLAQMVHGMIEDMGTDVREVADKAGAVCSPKPRRKRELHEDDMDIPCDTTARSPIVEY